MTEQVNQFRYRSSLIDETKTSETELG